MWKEEIEEYVLLPSSHFVVWVTDLTLFSVLHTGCIRPRPLIASMIGSYLPYVYYKYTQYAVYSANSDGSTSRLQSPALAPSPTQALARVTRPTDTDTDMGAAAAATVRMGSTNQARIRPRDRDRIGMRMRGYPGVGRARFVFFACA